MPRTKVKKQHEYSAGWFDYYNKCICLSRWEGNKRIVEEEDFTWYFFITEKDYETIQGDHKLLLQFEEMIIDTEIEKNGFVKVFADYDYEAKGELVNWIRDNGLNPLEADLPPFKRFMTDNEINIAKTQRILFYDIETDARTGWGDIEGHKLLSIAFHSTVTNKTEFISVKTLSRKSEEELLFQFLEVVREHDLLVAWNGDKYDEKVIRARCKKNKIYPEWGMVNWLDMMELFKKYYGRDATGSGVRTSFSLENIAQNFLKKGKVEDIRKDKLYTLIESDLEKLEEYNRRDVDLMVELDEKTEYIAAHAVLSRVCNSFLSSYSLLTGYPTDAFILRYGHLNNLHFPTKARAFRKGDDNWRKEKIEGAFVLEPVKGIHEGVCDLDFSSLYPSVIISWNISRETKVDESYKGPVTVAANGARFRKDVKGVFPEIVAFAVKMREQFKTKAVALEKKGLDNTDEHRLAKQYSEAWKVLANGSYGVLSSPHLRYYDPECGEAVTLTAKATIKMTIAEAEDCGIRVLYGDTDSLFILATEKTAIEFIEIMSKVSNEYAKKSGAKTGRLTLKVDAEYTRIFWTAMKKYAGKKSTGAVDIKGLELIRSDNCRYTREFQRAMISYLLDEKVISSKGAELLVEEWKDKLFSGKCDISDFVITVAIKKSLNEYATNLVHVRIAKKLLKDGKEFYQGMKIPYIMTKRKPKVEGVHIDDFDGFLNLTEYWNHLIFPPVERILKSVYPKDKGLWNEIKKYDPNQPTLFEGMKNGTKSKRTKRRVEGKK